MAFEVIPAVPMAFGRLVADETSVLPLPNPLAAAWHWMSVGARRIHVEDVGGCHGVQRGPVVPALLIGCRTGPAVLQVGGGIHTPETAAMYVSHGAGAVVLRWAWQHPEQLAAIVDRIGADRVVLAVSQAEAENVSTFYAWERWQALGLTRILLVGHFHQRGLFPSQQRLLRQFTGAGYAVWVGGGLRDLETVAALRDAGARGAVVGRALYQGKLPWEALRALAVPEAGNDRGVTA
ncbi:MAG: HisA/HisF-related TIM barrel protein [Firmicutes bacterium]|nr:HisA/HisF-related TIM barrel protein [Bacillota bacterium]